MSEARYQEVPRPTDIWHLSSSICFTPPRSEEFLHDLSAFFFKHAGANLNLVIQKIRVANSESRFDRSCSFVARAIDESYHSRLYQGACTHYARLNRRINHRVSYAVVTHLACGFSQRHDLCVSRGILIGSGSVSSDRENRITGNNAGAHGNLSAPSGFIGRGERLAHPMRIRFAFPTSSHGRNIYLKQRKIYYRWRAQTLSSEWFCQFCFAKQALALREN
jgi:hypothetical protein